MVDEESRFEKSAQNLGRVSCSGNSRPLCYGYDTCDDPGCTCRLKLQVVVMDSNGATPHYWRPSRPKDVPHRASFAFDPIEDALAAFARGEPVVVMDDEDRENEGDIIMAATVCSTEAMAWIIKHTRFDLAAEPVVSLTRCLSGFVCIALPSQRLAELEISMMVENNSERYRTAYALTLDYKHGWSITRSMDAEF